MQDGAAASTLLSRKGKHPIVGTLMVSIGFFGALDLAPPPAPAPLHTPPLKVSGNHATPVSPLFLTLTEHPEAI